MARNLAITPDAARYSGNAGYYMESRDVQTGTRNTNRDLAAIIGGIAAGILGSRLLPPLIAAATGSVRTRRGGDAFDLLIADHREILSLLDRMGMHTSGETATRGRLFLMLKRKLAKHALAEEDVVYPLLHNEGQEAEKSKELYDDHADIKILLFELEHLVKSGDDWTQPVGRLRDLIREHAEEEERVVFPKLREMLGQRRLPKVSGQISREEAMIL